MTRDELIQLRQRAGNLKTREIVRAVQACGYAFKRHGGDHDVYSKPGYAPQIIQTKMTSGTAIGIINRLISEQEEGAE